MEMMIERRGDIEGRMPLHLPIELEYDGLSEPFEADAVDVSTGGLALRTSCLPEIGTPLSCRFEVIPGGARIDAQGQVVWTRLDGPDGGEFGLRFVGLQPQDRALIAEMIAEREQRPESALRASASHADAAPTSTVEPTQAEGPAAPVAEQAGARAAQAAVITLDETAAEIEGQIAERGPLSARFEQPLDLLSVGQGLWLHAEDGRSRRAQIASVSLRLDGKTPLLAVQVEFDEQQASVHGLSWEESEEDEVQRDTVPDLEPPVVLEDDAQQRRTEVEFVWREQEPTAAPRMGQPTPRPSRQDAPSVALTAEAPASDRPRTAAGSLQEALAEATEGADPQVGSDSPAALAATEKAASGDHTGASQLTLELPAESPKKASAEFHQGAAERPDSSLAFKLELDEDEEPFEEQTPDWPRLRMPKTAWVSGSQFRTALRGSPLFKEGGAGLWLIAHVARMTEQARTLWSDGWAFVRENALPVLGSAVAIGSAKLRGKVSKKPKRRTAGKSPATARRRAKVLPLALSGLLALAAVALLSYALWPEEDPLLNAPSAATLPIAAPARAAGAPLLPQVVPGAATSAESPAIVPSPGQVPSGSPYAAEGQRNPAPASDGGPKFGASVLKNPTRFTLHMTGPIKDLRGMPDPGGFTVHVEGARSLDKAGPLASRHRALSKTMILNSGSDSDLTVRFAPGQQPKYRVSAQGTELVIEIDN